MVTFLVISAFLILVVIFFATQKADNEQDSFPNPSDIPEPQYPIRTVFQQNSSIQAQESIQSIPDNIKLNQKEEPAKPLTLNMEPPLHSTAHFTLGQKNLPARPADASNEEAKAKAAEITKTLLGHLKITINTNLQDDSIIDITGPELPIKHQEAQPNQSAVISWPHRYIYSHDDLLGANPEQIKFYQYFKKEFLFGKYHDLQGNSNYAFILLFDLIKESDKHINLNLLESQLNRLGEHYPQTKSYARTFLLKKMQKRGDLEGIRRIQSITTTPESTPKTSQQNYEIPNPIVNTKPALDAPPYAYGTSEYYQLGKKYKTKLNLNETEETWVNKLWEPDNNFCNIEFCLLQSLKLYVQLIKQLDHQFVQENSSLQKEMEAVAHLVATKQFRYRPGSYNYKSIIASVPNDIFALLFKFSENALREHYGHKRKISTDVDYPPEANNLLSNRILVKVNELIPQFISNAAPPDEATEKELNGQNTSRWKNAFDKLTETYKNKPATDFMEAVIHLGNLNSRNPSVENIFFEASKFISKSNKEVALKLYVHYLYHDLHSASFDQKPLNKTVQKSLFSNPQQVQDFEHLVSGLIKSRNLENALQAVPLLYQPKRKKISLNEAAILAAHQKHLEAANKLGEYLNEEYEDESAAIKVQGMGSEEMQLNIQPKVEIEGQQTLVNHLGLNAEQTELLELFSKNSYAVEKSELENFARSKGLFSNQLVESINDQCFASLDDVLIEEEEAHYFIYESTYQKLFVL